MIPKNNIIQKSNQAKISDREINKNIINDSYHKKKSIKIEEKSNNNDNSIIKENKNKKIINNNKEKNCIIEKDEKDKVFNRLKDLQSLLKKESALKELFIKTSNETKKNIEEQCREIYKKKLDVFYKLRNFYITDDNNEKIIKNFELIEKNSEYLKDLNNYIPKFLTYLWEDPKIMSEFLINSDINDIKKIIAPLLANNFYENILSFNYLQENFMFVLTLLCKEEISRLNSSNDILTFLQDTPCGCLLEQLTNKIDIKSYFNRILRDIIENIEIKCSERKMDFSIDKIEKQILDKKKKSIKKPNFIGKNNKNKKNEEENDVYRTNLSEKTQFNMGEILSFNKTNIDDNELDESGAREKIDKESSKLFSKKYTPDLTSKDFIEGINSCDDIRMKNYFQFQLNFCKTQDDYFSNNTFLAKVFESHYSTSLLNEYQLNFMKVIIIIKEIFNKLLNDLHLLPYSIKCICKIILLLIRKKFPKITATEENAFISKFFFCKLFVPIFKNPSIGALINNFIISGNTIHNLDIISSIILRLVSGRLYREGGKHSEYTPFNWFFMDEMPLVLRFFENLTKVELPKFIDNFIKDKIKEDYKYNYFKENPEQVIFHRSICFNIYEIKCLLENMNKCHDIIFKNNNNIGLSKTFDKLYSKKNLYLLNELINKQDNLLKNACNNSIVNYYANSSFYNNKNIIEKEMNIKKSFGKTSSFFNFKKNKEKLINEPLNKNCTIQYYLVTDLLINEQYKYIFDLKQNLYQFNKKELKQCQNEDDINKNIIIKVKNFFSSLLCNYRQLVKTDFDEGTTSSTINILKELRSFMKSSNYVIDGSIPSEWYVNSLIEYLNKLPKNLADNEYELLFNEMENDLNKSIKELDFETLSICLNKIKFVHKGILFYDETKQILIDILLNNKVKKIVEEETIKVEINFKYELKKKYFEIKEIEVKGKQLSLLDSFVSDQKRRKICNTVKEFCKNFPNLTEYQEKQGIDIFKMQQELEIPKSLQCYFDMIRKYLSKNKKITDKKSFELINEKIYDYVMSKIYNKIFPSESDNKDDKIFQNTIRLSWVEPKHFIPGKNNYVYDSFLPDVIRNFELLNREKSPRKKIISMSNIFASISNLVKFNNEGSNDIGVDDQMPILNYSLIRAKPVRIHSICRFLDLYIGDLRNKAEGNKLTQLLGICERVLEINSDSLLNVTEQEFQKKCTESSYGIGEEKDEKYF